VIANRKAKVIILGGGFGGLYAAMHLDRVLDRYPGLEVTLINRENFFLFTPMLHEVAASDLDLTNIVSPVRKLLKRVSFFAGEVEAIDLEDKKVKVSHGLDHHEHELDYDHLVIGLGSVTNFYGIPGVEANALTMRTLGDAIHLRNRLIALLEQADTECCTDIRRPLLTCVVAGGGFAGVETVAAVNDFIRHAVRFYSNLREDVLRVVLVHSHSVILPELGKSLGAYAQRKLAERKVEIRVNTKVTAASGSGVELSDGTYIPTRTLVWTAGASSNPLLDHLPCEKDGGRLVVDETLAVKDWPGVWALGDCALIPDRRTGNYFAPTAQHALREGRVLAHNILASLEATPAIPFTFSTIGQLVAIGRRTGVANILGLKFSGFFAWWLWRTIYLIKLPRFEKKLRVALDWTLDLLFSKDFVQFVTFRAPTISRAEEESGPHLRRAATGPVILTGRWQPVISETVVSP
jgi:NADH dehydrogenase